MRRYTADEIRTFFACVDQHLSTPETMIVLGGGALALAYDDKHRTTDIDTWSSLSVALCDAICIAQAETGIPIDVTRAGVADIPYEAETRLQPSLELNQLTVLVPDLYDLALSKTVRGYTKDVQAIEAAHKRQPLDVHTLVERYLHEMSHVEPARNLWLNFLNLIGILYGPREAARVKAVIPEPIRAYARRHRYDKDKK